jgi:hypothetical protein
MNLAVWGLVLTVAVTVAIAVAILLFERPRAREIEKDLHDQARQRRDPDPPDG